MKVKNMTSARGNKVANQFIIEDVFFPIADSEGQETVVNGDMFQSYNSNICIKSYDGIFLDANTWDYSVTTGKYRNQFLGETKAETQKKIDSGEYKLVNLN